MGKQVGPNYITGTVGDRTYYKLNGQYLVRAKSTLSRKRVKRSPAFRRTMEYAGWLAAASKLAAAVYAMMPRDQRKVKEYRQMTGRAMELIRQGADARVVKERLMAQYLEKKKAAQPATVPIQRRTVAVKPRKHVALFCTGHSVMRHRKGLRHFPVKKLQPGCRRE